MASQKEIKDFVCPFCSLHCDDIKVLSDGNHFKVNNKDLVCQKKIEKNNIKKTSLTLPMIKGKISSLSDALAAAKKAILITRPEYTCAFILTPTVYK